MALLTSEPADVERACNDVLLPKYHTQLLSPRYHALIDILEPPASGGREQRCCFKMVHISLQGHNVPKGVKRRTSIAF